MEVPDFQSNITLPASGDCFGINVVSHKEQRRPRAQCDELKRRAIFLDSANYKILRESLQRNCQRYQCAQIVGAFDSLFLAIDTALQKVPLQ